MTQVMMIRLSHARDSSTVRPEREKFIIKSATDAVTMAAILRNTAVHWLNLTPKRNVVSSSLAGGAIVGAKSALLRRLFMQA